MFEIESFDFRYFDLQRPKVVCTVDENIGKLVRNARIAVLRKYLLEAGMQKSMLVSFSLLPLK